MSKETKTNAMRLLDRRGIPYRLYTYACEHFTDGLSVARQLGQPPERTLRRWSRRARRAGITSLPCLWPRSWI